MMDQKNQRIIGLITDFGDGHYVASMKGVIYRINPEANIIDISHKITPFSIIEASYVIKATHNYFPKNSIFVIVVDPGVGSSREILGIKTISNQYFIGPNNGIFSIFLNINEIIECIELTNDKYFIQPVSKTFHGRDIMAPVGAYISIDIPLSKIGSSFDISNFVKVNVPLSVKGDKIECIIQYIDNFGNVVTNIPLYNDNFDGIGFVKGQKLVLQYNNKQYEGTYLSHFSAAKEKSIIFIKGSTNYLEISINRGNAAKSIGFKVGDILTIIY